MEKKKKTRKISHLVRHTNWWATKKLQANRTLQLGKDAKLGVQDVGGWWDDAI